MDEGQLVEAARRGDRGAFRAIFEEKRNRVYWTAYQILGDAEEAKDVTQRVFIKLWRNLDRYRSRFRFDTWLHRITRNAAIDAYRRRRAQREQSSPSDLEGRAPHALRAAPTQEGDQRLEEIQRIFDRLATRLTLKQRTAFTLREIQGLSTREVARIMRTTQSTVRNHVFQARKTLQAGIREEFPEYLPRGGERR